MSQPDQAATRALAELLAESQHAVTARIAQVVRGQTGSATILDDNQTLQDFAALVSRTLRMLQADRHTRITRTDPLACAIGAAWARRGCPLSDVLAAYGLPLRVMVAHVRELSDGVGGHPVAQLEVVGALFTFWNDLTAAIAAGYHSGGAHAADRERDELVRALLWGTTGAVEDFSGLLLTYGVGTFTSYHALRARPAADSSMQELAHAHDFTAGRRDDGGLCAVVDGKLVGFLTVVPSGRVSGVSGVGPARPLGRLSESFRMASRVLAAVDRRGLTGVHQFGDLGLLAAAVPDDDAVGESLARRYLRLGDNEPAAEILETIHEFLLNGMHVARTAERIFVHPNTVRYRIGRFEELARVSLRTDPLAMFEVLWALEYRAAQYGAVGAAGRGTASVSGNRRPSTAALPRSGRAA